MRLGWNHKCRALPLILAGFLGIYSAASARTKSVHGYEQSHFSAEDTGVRKPVQIPDSVLGILRMDENVRNVLEYEKIPAKRLPLSWFSASAIHLSSPERVDLVVMGLGPLRGANVITFWVFCATPQGYELALTAPAHDLFVKNTRSKGHRDIELSSMTSVQISTLLCRFSGRRYIAYRTTSEHIR